MAGCSKIKSGLAPSKVKSISVALRIAYLSLSFNLSITLQAFLSILLNLIIRVISFGEDSCMVNMMTSSVSHTLAGQHLSYCFKLARNQTLFIAMIGRQLLLYE